MHWPYTRITTRGDSHYGGPEAMAWCEQNAVQYTFGLATNSTLVALVEAKADAVRTRRATGPETVRDYTETPSNTTTCDAPRRSLRASAEASIVFTDSDRP